MARVSRDDRRHTKDQSSALEYRRTPGQRDRDRLLYSTAFRRLAGITQVVSPTEGQIFHNRLTHVLKVGQIGRRLAEKLLAAKGGKKLASSLGGLDPDVVEAAGLAHDLGHPPFGHVAEEALDHLVKKEGVTDGFEGNAQSFRIVTKLAMRMKGVEGLDLTRATLNAILKYPWFRGAGGGKKERKWGAYHTEQDDFEWSRELYPNKDERKSLEAEIMDWADDIAYSVCDKEDFYRAGKIPLDRLFARKGNSASDPLTTEANRFFDEVSARWKRQGRKLDNFDKYKNVFASMTDTFPIREPYNGSSEQRGDLRNLTSTLISRYMSAIKLSKPSKSNEPRVAIEDWAVTEVTILKELTWHYVINDRSLATQQYGYRRVIEELFAAFLKASEHDERWAMFPTGSRELLEKLNKPNQNKAERVRIVVDLIAIMTEQQALEMYQRLTGISFGSMLRSIV